MNVVMTSAFETLPKQVSLNDGNNSEDEDFSLTMSTELTQPLVSCKVC